MQIGMLDISNGIINRNYSKIELGGTWILEIEEG